MVASNVNVTGALRIATAGSPLVTDTDTVPLGARFASRTSQKPSASSGSPSESASVAIDNSMVGSSSSVTVTVTPGRALSVSPVYSAAPVAACDSATVSSSPSPSSAPVTRTVRQRLQFVASNAICVWSPVVPGSVSTVALPVDALTVTVTAALGSVFRRSRYVAVRPSSTVSDSGFTSSPGRSSSCAVASRSTADAPP